MNQTLIIESLSMDLLRVALGLHRGSVKMVARFKEEALRRVSEIESQKHSAYVEKLFTGTKTALDSDKKDSKEDILMYSVLFQNIARKMSASTFSNSALA